MPKLIKCSDPKFHGRTTAAQFHQSNPDHPLACRVRDGLSGGVASTPVFSDEALDAGVAAFGAACGANVPAGTKVETVSRHAARSLAVARGENPLATAKVAPFVARLAYEELDPAHARVASTTPTHTRPQRSNAVTVPASVKALGPSAERAYPRTLAPSDGSDDEPETPRPARAPAPTATEATHAELHAARNAWISAGSRSAEERRAAGRRLHEAKRAMAAHV